MGKYTKKEMTQAIENVIAYVNSCGCNTYKMQEIRNGMEKQDLILIIIIMNRK